MTWENANILHTPHKWYVKISITSAKRWRNCLVAWWRVNYLFTEDMPIYTLNILRITWYSESVDNFWKPCVYTSDWKQTDDEEIKLTTTSKNTAHFGGGCVCVCVCVCVLCIPSNQENMGLLLGGGGGSCYV